MDKNKNDGLSSAPGDAPAIGSVTDLYSGSLRPTLQIETARNAEHLFPTRIISKGKDVPVQAFENDPQDLSGLVIETDNGQFDFFDYLARNRTTALLVLKDDKVAAEYYEYGNNPQTRWFSMSMAKSVSTTLIGAAMQDGCIDSLDDQLTKYLPTLKGSGYDGVSVRHLLQMTSGVLWEESQVDPNSHRRKVLELQIDQRPGEILKYMATLPRIAEPGTRWNYSTGETHVVGELFHAATGRFLADYLSEKIWSKLGMEADAEWWLEAPGGLEVAGSGICATLKDYARFGRFIMGGGKIDGQSVLPPGWVREATAPRNINSETVNYGFMWWPVDVPAGAAFAPGFSARGIFGQYMYINPTENLIIVVWSARAKPIGSEVILDNDFFNSVVRHFRGEGAERVIEPVQLRATR